MMHLIYLAAGNSQRFHGNKLLYTVKDKPMFWHGLSTFLSCLDDEELIDRYGKVHVHMVVNNKFSRENITHNEKEERFYFCVNEHSEEGISSSIEVGLKSAQKYKGEEDYYLFFVADQPYLRWSTLKAFLLSFGQQEKQIGCVSYHGELGNPVVFGEKYIPDLLSLEKNTGGKRIVNKYPKDLFLYEVSNRMELRDIDTREDIRD